MKKKFLLVGDGEIAKRHKYAVKAIDGVIVDVYDPRFSNHRTAKNLFFRCRDEHINYAIICSPSNFHYEHTKLALSYNVDIIVEKPHILPWQPIIDDDRINVVLQLKWLDLPKEADLVKVVMVRDQNYFKSWKGNPQNTGGVFFNLFIHYILLAIELKAKFIGKITSEGKQERWVDDFDLTKIDMNKLYIKMYEDIVFHNKGIKPSDLFYLNWVLERCGLAYGIGGETLGRTIELDFKNGVGI